MSTSLQGICATQHSGDTTPRGFDFFSFQASQGLIEFSGQSLWVLGGTLQASWVLLLLQVDFIMDEHIIVFENLFPNIPGECKLQSISS